MTIIISSRRQSEVCQFNVVVPDLPNGDYPVRAEVAGVADQHDSAAAHPALVFRDRLSLLPPPRATYYMRG